MPDTRARASEAHQKSLQFTIADIARFLQETLGPRLVAHLAGVSDPKAATRWARGARVPRAEAEQRLRTAFQIFHLLQAEESAHTVRAWFIGINPQLEDEAPVDVIREGRLKDAWIAAEAYTSGG